MQLKNLALPLLLSSMALVAQEKGHSYHSKSLFDFYGFDQMEYYVGAGLGSSKLKNAALNRNTDAEIIKSTNKLKDLVQMLDYSMLQGDFYEQKGLTNKQVVSISNSDIAHPIPTSKLLDMNNARIKGLLTYDEYAKVYLPADAYKKQFDAKYKPELPSFNATGFYFDAENVTQFSAILGAKVLNEYQLFIGIEAQATYFKEQYESLEDTYKLQGKIYFSPHPQAKKIYLTNVKGGTLSRKSKAKVVFNHQPLKPFETFIGKDHIYATIELKRIFAFTGDVSFGKRFDLKNGMSLDAFAILGYGYTTFEVKNDDQRDKSECKIKSPQLKVVTYSFNEEINRTILFHLDGSTRELMRRLDGNILKFFKSSGALGLKEEVTNLALKEKNATGLRFGVGLTLNFQNQYAVSLKIVQAKLKGYTLLDDQLKSFDMSVSCQYKF